MSGKQTGKVWDLDLPHQELWVLSAMADNAHHDGTNCYPGDELLAWKTSYSVRTVQRVLAKLRERGIIELVGNEKGGRGRKREYNLHLDSGPMKPPFDPKRKGAKMSPFVKGDTHDVKGANDAPERVTPARRKGDTHAGASTNRQEPLDRTTSGTSLARVQAREVSASSGEGVGAATPITIPRGTSPRAEARLRRTATRLGAPLIHEGKP